MDFSFLAAALNTGPNLKSHLFWKLLGVSVMAETRLVKHWKCDFNSAKKNPSNWAFEKKTLNFEK